MESMKYGWTLERQQICKNAVSHDHSSSSSPAIMAQDASDNNPEDEELVRKRRQLHLIEEQIAHKKASIALKRTELQRTHLYCEKEDGTEGEEWCTEIEVETEHRKSSLLTNNNSSPRPPRQEVVRLTERQISILDELTQTIVLSKPAHSAPNSFLKSFVEQRNAEILQRDLEQKQRGPSDIKATCILKHKVEALRHHGQSKHALPPSFYKSPAEQADPFSLNHSLGTHSSSPSLKGFDRFLSVLNQGVDVERLSDIVNAAQTEAALNNQPDASVHGETCRTVDLNDNDLRDNHRKPRDKESLKNKRGSHGDSEEKDRGSRGKRSNSRDRHRHSDERRRRMDSRERDRDSRERDRDRDSRERDRDRDSRERDRERDSRERDRERDSRERDRDRDSRERDRDRDSRERDRDRDSRERDRDRDSRERDRGVYSRKRKRSWDSRERDRGQDSRVRKRSWNSRHRSLESREGYRDPKNRGSKSKMEDWNREWGNRERNGRHKDRNSKHYRWDSLSPRRRYSRDISRSRSSSSISSSSSSSSLEDDQKIAKKDQLSRIQTLLQTVELDLGIEEVDRLSSRTQERLYGVKHPRPRGRGDHMQQRRHRDPSWSDSSDDYSPDSHHRRRDSQEPRGSLDTFHPPRISNIDLSQSAQCSTGTYPVGPAPQNLSRSQPPPANYSGYTASYLNSYDGQYHSTSVQSWTAVQWSGTPPSGSPYPSGPPLGNTLPGNPQFTPPPSLVTGSHNAPYQFPPPQYPPHWGPPPLLPQPQPPPHLPPPPQPPPYLPPPPQPPSYLPPPQLPQLPSHLYPPPNLQPPLCSAPPNLPSFPPPSPKQMAANPNHIVGEKHRSSKTEKTRFLKVLTKERKSEHSAKSAKIAATTTPVETGTTALLLPPLPLESKATSESGVTRTSPTKPVVVMNLRNDQQELNSVPSPKPLGFQMLTSGQKKNFYKRMAKVNKQEARKAAIHAAAAAKRREISRDYTQLSRLYPKGKQKALKEMAAATGVTVAPTEEAAVTAETTTPASDSQLPTVIVTSTTTASIITPTLSALTTIPTLSASTTIPTLSARCGLMRTPPKPVPQSLLTCKNTRDLIRATASKLLSKEEIKHLAWRITKRARYAAAAAAAATTATTHAACDATAAPTEAGCIVADADPATAIDTATAEPHLMSYSMSNTLRKRLRKERKKMVKAALKRKRKWLRMNAAGTATVTVVAEADAAY